MSVYKKIPLLLVLLTATVAPLCVSAMEGSEDTKSEQNSGRDDTKQNSTIAENLAEKAEAKATGNEFADGDDDSVQEKGPDQASVANPSEGSFSQKKAIFGTYRNSRDEEESDSEEIFQKITDAEKDREALRKELETLQFFTAQGVAVDAERKKNIQKRAQDIYNRWTEECNKLTRSNSEEGRKQELLAASLDAMAAAQELHDFLNSGDLARVAGTDLQTPNRVGLKKAAGFESSGSSTPNSDDGGLAEETERLVFGGKGTPQFSVKKSVAAGGAPSNSRMGAASKINKVLFRHDEEEEPSASKVAASSSAQKSSASRLSGPSLEAACEEMTSDIGKVALGAESDASPYSSDEEYGAKTLMRKVIKFVEGTEDRGYSITKRTKQPRTKKNGYQVITPTVTEEEISESEIRENRDRYYIANFSGEYLDYIKNNEARRKHVKQAVDKTCDKRPPSYSSIARRNLEKSGFTPVKVNEEMNKLNSPGLVQNTEEFVKGYVTKAHSGKKIQKVSPTYGNPVLSTSKDPEITTYYSDHPEEASVGLHPRYSNEDKKPKHRLIGLTAVVVHEANKYLTKAKADVEKLRTEGKVGQMGLRDLNNQEVIFPDMIESEDIAGYVPLIYPNMSKMEKATKQGSKGKTQYTSDEKGLFGLEGNTPWRMAQTPPLSLSLETKKQTLYPLNRRLQWKLAEKYVKDKNPDGELIWVDHDGKFRRFKVNKAAEKE